jgi:hypothetical protein
VNTAIVSWTITNYYVQNHIFACLRNRKERQGAIDKRNLAALSPDVEKAKDQIESATKRKYKVQTVLDKEAKVVAAAAIKKQRGDETAQKLKDPHMLALSR